MRDFEQEDEFTTYEPISFTPLPGLRGVCVDEDETIFDIPLVGFAIALRWFHNRKTRTRRRGERVLTGVSDEMDGWSYCHEMPGFLGYLMPGEVFQLADWQRNFDSFFSGAAKRALEKASP